jgi:CRP/FNR family transcriptional regulator, cyclic AMP receptor protein
LSDEPRAWEDELRDLGAVRSFPRGQALAHVAQVPSEVFVLRCGRVKVTATTPAGRTVLLALRGPGELVGELSALSDSPRSASVIALDPVEALAIPHERFRRYVHDHPDAAMRMLRTLTDRLKDADAKRVQIAAYTTLERVAFCLLELSERFGSEREDAIEITLPLSQEELASWAGASLESVGRALQQMRGLGWIETRRRAIRVLDPHALRDHVK